MVKRITVLTLLGMVTGAIVGALAVGFVDAILFLNDRLYLSTSGRASLADPDWMMAATIGIPAAAGLVVGLLRTRFPGDRFDGPAEAIRHAQTGGSPMPIGRGAVSAVAACLSLGAGASAGQYGPLAHLGASLGSWFNRITGYDRSLGTISIACGAAAAISAAFHAPIAGLVFAREVVLRHASLRAFAPIAVSSTVAYVVAKVGFDRSPLFAVAKLDVERAWEYAVFIAIGIAGAVLATAFMRCIELSESLANRLPLPAPLKTAAAGLALGVAGLQVPEVLGIGQEVLRTAMTGLAFSATDLIVILIGKLLVTGICLGFGFAGGVFSPALLIGTLFGALVGMGAGSLVPDQQSQVAIYAVCGLVAVASPVIGAPLAAVLIVFELTQNYELATAAIVSAAFANLVGFRIYGRSFYDVQLQSTGFDLSTGRDKVTAQQYPIRSIIESDFTAGTFDVMLADIRKALIRNGHSEAYIVDAGGHYTGTISLHRLMELITEGASLDLPAGEFAEPESVILSPDTSVWSAMSRLKDFVGESIPVVEDGRLVGVLYESAIVSAYLEIMSDVRQDEHAAL